jgi:hypothetical protein
MLRIIVFVLVFTSPAVAEQQAYSWGGSYAHIKADAGGAVVMLHNGQTVTPHRFILFGLEQGGIVVSVEVDQGNGDIPDTVTVRPPVGFMALPPTVVMDEGADAVIRIDPIPMG